MRQHVLITLSLNACSNQMWQELSYLLTILSYKVEAKTASTNLTWLYFYLHISIQIFSALFICFVVDGPLQSIYFRMFCYKHSITSENTYLLSF